MALIERAIDALDGGAHADAYRELIAAWRDAPNDELATIATEVLALVPARPEFAGRKWHALLAARDPVDVPTLVNTVEHVGIAEMVARLPLLAELPADPTLAHLLARILADMRWRSLDAIAAYVAICSIVARGGGGREVDLVEAALRETVSRDAALRVGVIDALRATIAVLRERPATGPDLAALRTAVAAAQARRAAHRTRTTALFAAVYAAPEDDGPRLALADHLSEVGDPRGELITLQCAPRLAASQRQRADELVASFGDAWLDLWVTTRGLRYARGFPVAFYATLVGKSLGHPAWSTIEKVTLRDQQTAAIELFDPVCRSLRVVHGMNAATMAHVVTTTHPTTIVELGFRHADHGFDHLPSALHVFPRLRELQVHDGFELVTIGRVLTRRPLERLVVHGTLTPDHVGLLGSHLAELVAIDHSYTLRFTREDPDTGYLAFGDHGWRKLVHLDLAVTPRRLVIDRSDPCDCVDCRATICSDAELAARLGCEIEWR
jgi:uncharacterized protein (TIGR02996 family)